MISLIKIILPSLLAFVLGMMYGGRLKFTGSLKVALVAGVIFSFLMKTYPYYTAYYSALPSTFSEILFMALLGVLYGSISRRKDEANTPAH